MDDDFFSILTAIRFGRDICVQKTGVIDDSVMWKNILGQALLQITVLLFVMYKVRDIFSIISEPDDTGGPALPVKLSGRLGPLLDESLILRVVDDQPALILDADASCEGEKLDRRSGMEAVLDGNLNLHFAIPRRYDHNLVVPGEDELDTLSVKRPTNHDDLGGLAVMGNLLP